MMRIEVTEDLSEERQAGRNRVREQAAYIKLPGEKYPKKTSLTIWEDSVPLKAGWYEFDPAACVYVGRFDRLEFSLKADMLKPAQKAEKAA